MSGGQFFCNLDINNAYLHMKLDNESALMQSLSMHKEDLSGIVCFFGNIAIQGRTREELYTRLRAVLDPLRLHGLRLNKKKCTFFAKSITYLGHTIDSKGLHTSPDNVKAILQSPRPNDMSQLRGFLGLVHYYQKFIVNLSTKLHPFYALLRNNVSFKWTKICEKAFNDLKTELSSTKVLIPYRDKLPLILATDASPKGIGAVISHITDGDDQ
ncbi:RNase H-like domain found in reverse transcriptase [Popillia japonica]|uniref:RNA-directed DNA polymerase n=1 Tax=Popillia japonica TaxID=7064 RepID=A0AAW1MAT4_POPJA